MTPTNALAEKLDVGAQPLPEIPEIAVMPVKLTRRDIWTPEVWAEIEAVQRGER